MRTGESVAAVVAGSVAVAVAVAGSVAVAVAGAEFPEPHPRTPATTHHTPRTTGSYADFRSARASSAIPSAIVWILRLSGPSIMTRSFGSVPDQRTSTRPF